MPQDIVIVFNRKGAPNAKVKLSADLLPAKDNAALQQVCRQVWDELPELREQLINVQYVAVRHNTTEWSAIPPQQSDTLRRGWFKLCQKAGILSG